MSGVFWGKTVTNGPRTWAEVETAAGGNKAGKHGIREEH